METEFSQEGTWGGVVAAAKRDWLHVRGHLSESANILRVKGARSFILEKGIKRVFVVLY